MDVVHQSTPTVAAEAMAPSDPVRQRRARIDAWARTARRAGYTALAASSAAVAVGATTTFTPLLSSIATVALIAGSILLAPAIVVGYAVKAAERDDRERGI
jgi:cytochrome c biogenesis protein CcdA